MVSSYYNENLKLKSINQDKKGMVFSVSLLCNVSYLSQSFLSAVRATNKIMFLAVFLVSI